MPGSGSGSASGIISGAGIATYDAALLQSVPLYAVRFHAADTSVTNAIWSDDELLYVLSLIPVPELAAARALRSAAADAAKLAVITKIGQLGNDETKVSEKLLEMAAALEGQAIYDPLIADADAPVAIFTTDKGSGNNLTIGTMSNW